MDWQPIETAPKPGLGAAPNERYVLGFIPDEDAVDLNSCMSVVWWEPVMRGGTWWCDGDYAVHPTHWMPLPKPPATDS